MGKTLSSTIEEVRRRIAAAAARVGREADDVTLVAVSKTVDAGRIGEAVKAGQTVFGENRVQEAREKIPLLPSGLEWRLIGHLQKNKARVAAGLFHAVDSLDSEALARELDRRAGQADRKLKVLLQVKEADEAAKSGVSPAELPMLIEKVIALPNLRLEGLMTIPPWPANPEDSRPFFSSLRRLREKWDGNCCPSGTLRHLSMGMTADYEVAIEEGATIVRVGSAIFGARSYGPD